MKDYLYSELCDAENQLNDARLWASAAYVEEKAAAVAAAWAAYRKASQVEEVEA